MAFWVILSGILGARLYYVLFNLGYFSENLSEILAVWKGGLAIHGALIGGAVAFFIFAWRKKLPRLMYLDIIIPGVILAQAIGRWGNFFNSEAFGRPTNLPWKLFIPEASRPDELRGSEYFHPTFLYESIWNLAGFGILVILNRYISSKPNRAGTVFFAYLIWYSIGRFFIESLRTDSLYAGQLRTAQIASVLFIVMGIGGLIYTQYKSRNINKI